MPKREGAESPDVSSRPAIRRKTFGKPVVDEHSEPKGGKQFPDHPWFPLNHEDIKDFNTDLCSKFKRRLQRYAAIDKSIESLIRAAENAKTLPNAKILRLAVPGEQGIGKSTLINALLNRNILSTSGGSKACTSFVTIIKHKPGAGEDTTLSDVTIDFWSLPHMEADIDEHILHWYELHPGPDHENLAKNTGDVYESDQDDEEDFESDEPNHETAQEFFEVIFNTQGDAHQEEWLHYQLDRTDIRLGDFRSICRDQAEKQLQNLEALKVQDGRPAHQNISDTNLKETRNHFLTVWPFVEKVTIATGHMLLRDGLQVYDMPGNLFGSERASIYADCCRIWRYKPASRSHHQQVSQGS
jgi:hypothetical protein